jgi:flagellar motor switch protein FliG
MQSLSKKAAAFCVVFAAAMVAVGLSAAQEQPASNMEILRDKIKADKKLLVAENLGLSESEAKVFWPVYEEFQKELEALNQRLGKAIQSYAQEYNAKTLTDEKAKTLMTEALAIEEAEVALKKKYLDRLNGVIPAIKAARYLQIENKIRALIRFDLAANIPLAP